MTYNPHTTDDVTSMLKAIGANSVEELFDEIPKNLLCQGLQNIPDAINEMDLLKHAQKLGQKNKQSICFIGAGSYEHHIPAAVWDIASRGEFLTAYTPYQAEASQGTLQLLYEFQTMIAELTGMDVANASMYDGATALAEAILMAARIKNLPNNKVLINNTLHPLYKETVVSILKQQDFEIIESSLKDLNNLNINLEDVCALVVQQPNFFGNLEEVDTITNWAHAHNLLLVACVNPTSLSLLNPPGLWGNNGADIVCGDGQPLGCPMASGGPYFGFLSTKIEYVRQMPGRIIGQTTDLDGKRGFSLTLQAREQHIRRAKATSNICTNQGLLVTAASVYMSLLGSQGLKNITIKAHNNTKKLVDGLTNIAGVKPLFNTPYLYEAALEVPINADILLEKLMEAGIAGGYALKKHFPHFPESILVCATEMRSDEDIQLYIDTMNKILTSELL